jgi:hypothetical protein
VGTNGKGSATRCLRKGGVNEFWFFGVVGCIRDKEKYYRRMRYKNMLIERGGPLEPPYPAMGGECPRLPTEDNEAQKDAEATRAEWADEAPWREAPPG